MMISAAPSAIARDLGLQRAGRSVHVRTQRRDPRVRPERRRLLAQPFHAGADGGQLALRLAGGAGLGHRFAFAALVADQALEEPVFDHARVAVIAADLMPAGPAERDRRIAAPVDEKHRLFAALKPLVDFGAQGRRYPAVARQPLDAHVDGAHLRHDGGDRTARSAPAGCICPPRRWPSFPRLGVAEASTTCAPQIDARSTAMSRAL